MIVRFLGGPSCPELAVCCKLGLVAKMACAELRVGCALSMEGLQPLLL